MLNDEPTLAWPKNRAGSPATQQVALHPQDAGIREWWWSQNHMDGQPSVRVRIRSRQDIGKIIMKKMFDKIPVLP